jgi:hypothetical protein
MGNAFRQDLSSREESSCIPMYGHFSSDLSVFIANLFMLGYSIESIALGYTERCEYPLQSWLIGQAIIIFVLQICSPLLLVIPRTPNVLNPVLASALFLTQWIILFAGWSYILAPSNCVSSAPNTYTGAYWILVVYSVAIPLETVWYIKFYQSKFFTTNGRGGKELV